MTAVPLSPDSFRFIDWSALAVAKPDAIHEPRHMVRSWMSAATSDEQRAALSVLGDLLLLGIDTRESSTEGPLVPADILHGIDADGLKALVELGQDLTSDYVRSRVIDVAWARRICSHRDVASGVAAYLNVARALLDPNAWIVSYEHICRAVGLSVSLGRRGPLALQTLKAVESFIDSVGAADPLYFVAATMRLLLSHRHGDPGKYALLARSIAQAAEVAGDYSRAVDHLDVAQEWYRLNKDDAQMVAVQRDTARLREQHATVDEGSGELHIAVMRLSEAVEAWRRVPNADAEVQRVRLRLQTLQRSAAKICTAFSQEVDLSDCAASARDHVSGKPIFEALVALVALHPPTPRSRLEARVRERARQFIFRSLLPQVRISETGRRVHMRGALLDGDDDALLSEVRSELTSLQQFIALGAVSPAAEQLQCEHGLTHLHLLGLVRRSSFVPEERAYSFAKGLAFGFQGDFVTACHLLIPQFENALRSEFERRGVIVSTLPSSNAPQNEHDLNVLLQMPQAEAILGPDQLFDISTLLVQKSGSNLRNVFAHGLVSDGHLIPQMIYFWWIALRFVMLPILQQLEFDGLGAEPERRGVTAERTVRERAYFLWKNQTGHAWWDPVSNWLEAETMEPDATGCGPIVDGHS